MRMVCLKAILVGFLAGFLALVCIAPQAQAGTCNPEILQKQHLMRDRLADVARNGLRGDHHFSIIFRTAAKGVRVPADQRAKYPEIMSIILQYQFEHLAVTEDRFEVDLFFKGVRKRLTIPFDAVTDFSDPSTKFQLTFDPAVEGQPCGMAI